VSSQNLPDLTPPCAALLYRTAREALANVARHAQARTVWVRLERTDHGGSTAVRLVVADDGVGFSTRTESVTADARPEATVRSNGHFGLRLVRDRVAEEGGTVTIGNRDGGGAVLEVLVPVAE
jgi:signal transduction histidine kinase